MADQQPQGQTIPASPHARVPKRRQLDPAPTRFGRLGSRRCHHRLGVVGKRQRRRHAPGGRGIGPLPAVRSRRHRRRRPAPRPPCRGAVPRIGRDPDLLRVRREPRRARGRGDPPHRADGPRRRPAFDPVGPVDGSPMPRVGVRRHERGPTATGDRHRLEVRGAPRRASAWRRAPHGRGRSDRAGPAGGR